MKYKKGLLIICLIICLFSIASVCASEVNETDVASENQIEIDSGNDNVPAIDEQDVDEVGITEENELSATPGKFSALSNLIKHSNGTVKLSRDYEYGGGAITGITISKTVTVDGNGHELNGNKSSRIFLVEADNVVLKNIKFVNGKHTQKGGALYITGKNCKIINCSFIGGSANSGGGAYGGTVINSSFTGNSASYGGALSNAEAINCTFENNIGKVHSGALLNVNAYNCTLTNNSAPSAGAMKEGSSINCIFTNNHAKYGGAIYNSFTQGSVFNDNYANTSGGAAYNSTVTDCNFTNNSAKYGGAVYFSSAINCIFTDNNANYGGALGKGNATRCTFINNYAEYGGALYESHVRDSIFMRNAVNAIGGAIYKGSCENCTFSHNTATKYAGAGFEISVENSTFINNSAEIGGALAYTNGGSIENCTFKHNHAKKGGTIYITTVDLTVIPNCKILNCIFTENTGAAIMGNNYRIYEGYIFIDNCEFIDNENGAVSSGYETFLNNSNFYNNTHALNLYGTRPHNVLNCIFENNYNTVANISSFGSDTIENCSFINNHEGITLNIEDHNSIVKNCCFINNTGKYNIFLEMDSNIENCVFENNSCRSIVFQNLETSRVINCSFKNINNDAIVSLYFVKDIPDIPGFYVEVVNCSFTNIHGYALEEAMAINSTFSNMNHTIVSRAQTVNCTFTNCIKTATTIWTYYDDKYMGAHLSDINGYSLIGCTVRVQLNGKVSNLITDYNGNVELNIQDLLPDVYTAIVSFAGNEMYLNSKTSEEIIIYRSNPELICSPSSFTYGDGKSFVVTLKDENDVPITNHLITVSFEYNKVFKLRTDKNGQIRISSSSVVPKTYEVTVKSQETRKYYDCYKFLKITVKKATPKLTAKAKTFKKSVKTKKYSITLKDNQNKAMKNTKVTIKINKKTYTAKTNNKGKATFKIKKLTKKGTYKATVTYKGNAYYNKVTKKVNIKVK